MDSETARDWQAYFRDVFADEEARAALKALLTEDATVQAVREMRASRGAGLSHWSDDVETAVDALAPPEGDA